MQKPEKKFLKCFFFNLSARNWPYKQGGHQGATRQWASASFPAYPSVFELQCPAAAHPCLDSPLHKTETNLCYPAEQRQTIIHSTNYSIMVMKVWSREPKRASTGVVAPVGSWALARVRVMSASVAEVNHLKPCSLYEPSVWGIATVSVPLAEERRK